MLKVAESTFRNRSDAGEAARVGAQLAQLFVRFLTLPHGAREKLLSYADVLAEPGVTQTLNP